MNRREQFKPGNQCRADGCNGEVFFKVSQGNPALDSRQAGIRSPLNPLNGGFPAPNQLARAFPEGPRVLSSFCKKRGCFLACVPGTARERVRGCADRRICPQILAASS